MAFVAADAGATNLLGDVVLCIGAAHAFGDTDRALAELGRRVTAGGAVLFGDGFWERGASTEAIELFGPLKRWDELFAAAAIAGYMVVGAERSTQEEWDTFEDLWLAGPLGSADPDIRATAEERARQYREVYRGILGFAWLMLKPE